MTANTKIEWADHTFNPWVGCTKVSPACDHCYAEAWAKRTGNPQLWQPGLSARRRTSAANWRQPLKWNAEAQATGTRPRVFCASLADVFDNQVPDEWRRDLWDLIESTPYLTWLLLTKRIGNAMRMLRSVGWAAAQRNVWLGATVANQEEAERDIPKLLHTPARVRFLSIEPLLGPVDLVKAGAIWSDMNDNPRAKPFGRDAIDWVIAGGESGGGVPGRGRRARRERSYADPRGRPCPAHHRAGQDRLRQVFEAARAGGVATRAAGAGDAGKGGMT